MTEGELYGHGCKGDYGKRCLVGQVLKAHLGDTQDLHANFNHTLIPRFARFWIVKYSQVGQLCSPGVKSVAIIWALDGIRYSHPLGLSLCVVSRYAQQDTHPPTYGTNLSLPNYMGVERASQVGYIPRGLRGYSPVTEARVTRWTNAFILDTDNALLWVGFK